MNPRRLLNTTAMRLALRYALFYAVLIALGLGMLYWATSRYVDVQVIAGLEHEIHKFQRVDEEQGRARLKSLLQMASGGTGEDRRYYLLQEANSGHRVGNLLGWPHPLKLDGKVHSVWVEHELIPGNQAEDDGYWPMIAVTLGDGSRLLVAHGIRQAEDLQEFVLATMGAVLAVSVGLALVMGWRLGRTLLARIDRINETAQRVTAGDLSRRMPLSGQDDEFDELAGHLNTMLKRIESLLTGMRHVSDNVAHDLRKPLTRVRNRLEVTLLEARDGDEYRRVMGETLRDVDELMRTFNALLEIAQAEAGSFRGEWGTVDLSALLRNLVELYQDQAEAQDRQFSAAIDPDLTVQGNRDLLAQVFSNLLDNAFKHTGERGTVHVEAKLLDGRVRVLLSDNGPGIPLAQRENVLQRFTRLEAARSTPGNGLGLSLVKAIADLHTVALQLEDNQPGLRVILVFSDHQPAEAAPE